MKKLLMAISIVAGISNTVLASENDDSCYPSGAGYPQLSRLVQINNNESIDESLRTSQRAPYDPSCIDENSKREIGGTLSLAYRILRFFGAV